MILNSPQDIGFLIKDQRAKLGLDQEALARQAGTSRKWIVEIEKGKPGAAIGLILRTLRVLGITLQSNPKAKASPGEVDLNHLIDSLKRRK